MEREELITELKKLQKVVSKESLKDIRDIDFQMVAEYNLRIEEIIELL